MRVELLGRLAGHDLLGAGHLGIEHQALYQLLGQLTDHGVVELALGVGLPLETLRRCLGRFLHDSLQEVRDYRLGGFVRAVDVHAVLPARNGLRVNPPVVSLKVLPP
ncbi:unnamed protein product [Ixodes pacificus]